MPDASCRVRRLGRALYAPVFDSPVRPANTARFTFLDPRAADFYSDWERTADDMVVVLRVEVGRNPYDRGLTDLIGELSTRSETFRTCSPARSLPGGGAGGQFAISGRRRRVPRGTPRR